MVRPVVLHVEDQADDAFFLRWAFQKAGNQCLVLRVKDAEGAVAYLAGHGVYSNRAVYPLPDVVLLDLKLPCMSGLDLLETIRASDANGDLPVVVLSGADVPRDKQRAAALRVQGYFLKTPHYADVVDAVCGLVGCVNDGRESRPVFA